MSTSISGAVFRTASEIPSAVAVDDGTTTLTYATLASTAEVVASNLAAVGASGATVAVCLGRSATAIAVLLGVIRAGCAYVPIDPRAPRSRREFVVADSGAAALITDTQFDLDLPTLSSADACAGKYPSQLVAHPDHAEPVYIIYTSGSTGVPKGVVVTHANVANLASWHIRAFGLDTRSRVAQFAPLSFDASAWEIWPCLIAGGSLHLVPEALRSFQSSLVRWIGETRISHTFLPTPVAEAALDELVARPGDLRWLLTGGDRLRRFDPGLQCRFVNAYGPTEATVLATAGVVPSEAEATTPLPSLGRAIQNVAVYVLDPDLEQVAEGEIGELCIAGAGVASGYRGRPDEENLRFVTWRERRIYRTGDLGRRLAGGEFYFEGRGDRQVKLRGHRVELAELEVGALALPGVTGAAAIAVPDHDEVALFVTSELDQVGAAAVLAHLRTVVPRQVLPRVVVVQDLPQTSHGKIDHTALERLAIHSSQQKGGVSGGR